MIRPMFSGWVTRLGQVVILVLVVAAFWYAASPVSPLQDGSRTVVTWLVAVSDTKSQYEQLIEQFEQEHPDIDIRPIWVPASQYQSKFKTLAAASQAPDVFATGDVWVAYMLPFLKDLTPLVERDREQIDLDDFYPRVLAAAQHEGRFYFLPNTLNLSLLYYNKSLFHEAGMELPTAQWQWSDYIEAGRKLTASGSERAAIWGSDIVLGWWGEWLIEVRQAGGRVFNKAMTRCVLDEPEAIEGIRFYYDKVYQYQISPPPGYRPSTGFASGRMAIVYGGHTGRWQTYNQVPGLEWDVQMLPIGPSGRSGGEIAMGAYGISKTTDHLEAAWTFLKHLISRQTIAMEVEAGTLSVRRSVAEELLLGERSKPPYNMDAVYAQLEYAEPIPRHPDYIELMMQIVQPEIDRMMQGEQTPEQACRRAAQAANRYLEVLGSVRR